MKDTVYNKDYKLFGKNAILVSCFFTGPLAAGFMIYRNYLNTDQKRKANNALLVSVLFLLAYFIFIHFISDHVNEKLITSFLPLVTSTIVYVYIKERMFDMLAEHKEQGGRLYPFPLSFLTAIVSLFVTVVMAIALSFVLPPTEQDKVLEDIGRRMDQNEIVAMELYTMLENGTSDQECVGFIREKGLPLWKENKVLLKEMERNMDDLGRVLTKNQFELYDRYFDLRIAYYELFLRLFEGDTDPQIPNSIIKTEQMLIEVMQQMN